MTRNDMSTPDSGIAGEPGNILESEAITPNNIRRADPSVSLIDHKNISGRDSGAFMAVVNVRGIFTVD